MTNIYIEGQPLARFYLRSMLSWNDVYGHGHWRRATGINKKWRRAGEKLALRVMERLRTHRAYLVRRRAFVLVKVVRGTERRYDVHNVFVKALLDGFSDGRIWPDDEWPYVPTVMFTWAEDERGLGQHFVVEVHEYGSFFINGVAQQLPEGRHGR